MRQGQQDFNSRPSARGDGVCFDIACNSRRISIHAPPRGATRFDFALVWLCKHFNSRPSARGDKKKATATQAIPDFNSRPSARGDKNTSKIFSRIILFQFTPLREGRLSKSSLCLYAPIFQFTPLREGRLGIAVLKFSSFHFNSRPSARGDVPFVQQHQPSDISIHAPPRGATRPNDPVDALFPISIHAPPRGATRIRAT